MKRDEISLYYKDGSSDKEYHACIEDDAGGLPGCVVNFAFGRRGSTLQTGTKTQSPIPYEKAKGIFDKLVAEKAAKGYTQGASGTPYVGTASEKRSTGILPQLLNAIEESEVDALIADPDFWMQEKKDGRRILVKRVGGKAVGINRKGLEVGLPEPIAKAAVDGLLAGFDRSVVLDGECVGDVYHVFDLLELDGKDLRGLGYGERLGRLTQWMGSGLWVGAVRMIETAIGKAEKTAVLERLKKEGREGVVFKDTHAKYVAGRPASGGSQLKFKFYATCSCVVSKVNAKRSVALELLNILRERLDGKATVGVGNCTIPPNHAVPKVGDIVEIRYLYCYKGGSLYQPTYLGIRDDIDNTACVLSQLKYRAKDDEDEA